MKLLLAIFLATMVAVGQTPAPTVAGVQGRVQSSTGGPVTRATVTIAKQSATTDEQGHFKIDGIPPGRDYQLIAQSRGYVRGAYGARRAGGQGTPLTLAAGDAAENLTIILTPQGVVTGHVIDAAGDPVQGAPVSLMRSMFVGASRQLELAQNATTDDRGAYRFAEVVPGSYRLLVTDRRSGSRLEPDTPSTGSGLITYYPDAGDPLGAAPIQVSAGIETSGIDVRLRAPRTYAIRGKAIDVATDGPLVGVNISLTRNDGSPSLMFLSRVSTRTEPDGTFEFTGLDPGPYALQIRPQARGPDITALRNVLITKGDEEDVVLEVRPGAVLTGTMRLDEGDIRSLIPRGSPDGKGIVPGSQEHLLFANAHMLAIKASVLGQKVSYRPSVELRGTDPAVGSEGMGLLQEDGEFQMAHIAAGRYYMSVLLLPQGYFVKSAIFNGTDTLQAPLDLTQSGGELHIVLSNKSADVTGSLRDKDGKPLPTVQVTLWPKTALLGLYDFGIRKAVTDQNGAFEFRNVLPGEYYLAGWEDAETGLLTSPEFLNLFRSDAIAVKLAENDRTRVDAKMIPSDDIAAETGLP